LFELAATDMPEHAKTTYKPRKIPLINERDPLYTLLFMANSSPYLEKLKKMCLSKSPFPTVQERMRF
jgi:hypothetical protein